MICTSKEPSKRPDITKLIDSFYDIFLLFMQEEADSFDLNEVTNNYKKKIFFILEFQKQLEMFYSSEIIKTEYKKIYQKIYKLCKHKSFNFSIFTWRRVLPRELFF